MVPLPARTRSPDRAPARPGTVRPVRIVHLTDCYLPRLGGIEMQVHDLARRQLAAGHEVTSSPPPRPPQAAAGRPTTTASTASRCTGWRCRLPYELPVNPRAAPASARSCPSGRFDVAHVHAGVVSPFAFGGGPGDRRRPASRPS